MTNPVYDKLRNCYDSIKGKIPFEPKVALVLGSVLVTMRSSWKSRGPLITMI